MGESRRERIERRLLEQDHEGPPYALGAFQRRVIAEVMAEEFDRAGAANINGLVISSAALEASASAALAEQGVSLGDEEE